MTLGANERCYNVTVLTRLGRSKLLNILRAFLAYSVGFTLLLELRSAVCALDNGMSNAALLAELLPLGELLERVPLVTLGAGVQSRGHLPAGSHRGEKRPSAETGEPRMGHT